MDKLVDNYLAIALQSAHSEGRRRDVEQDTAKQALDVYWKSVQDADDAYREAVYEAEQEYQRALALARDAFFRTTTPPPTATS